MITRLYYNSPYYKQNSITTTFKVQTCLVLTRPKKIAVKPFFCAFPFVLPPGTYLFARLRLSPLGGPLSDGSPPRERGTTVTLYKDLS